MSSNLAGERSWAEPLALEATNPKLEAFRGPLPDPSDAQDIYPHDTIPSPPPDGTEDFELDTD